MGLWPLIKICQGGAFIKYQKYNLDAIKYTNKPLVAAEVHKTFREIVQPKMRFSDPHVNLEPYETKSDIWSG